MDSVQHASRNECKVGVRHLVNSKLRKSQFMAVACHKHVPQSDPCRVCLKTERQICKGENRECMNQMARVLITSVKLDDCIHFLTKHIGPQNRALEK